MPLDDKYAVKGWYTHPTLYLLSALQVVCTSLILTCAGANQSNLMRRLSSNAIVIKESEAKLCSDANIHVFVRHSTVLDSEYEESSCKYSN